jgi:hypothetical protein
MFLRSAFTVCDETAAPHDVASAFYGARRTSKAGNSGLTLLQQS